MSGRVHHAQVSALASLSSVIYLCSSAQEGHATMLSRSLLHGFGSCWFTAGTHKTLKAKRLASPPSTEALWHS